MGFILIEKTEIPSEVIRYLREMEKHGGTISKRNCNHDYLNFPTEEIIEKAKKKCWELDLIYKSDCGDGPMLYSITSRGKLVLEQALDNFC